MKILKFGGSSVSTAERIRAVIAIVKDDLAAADGLIIVVSAFGGVTDELIALGRDALAGDYHARLKSLKERHLAVAEALVERDESLPLLERLGVLFGELEDACKGVLLIKELSKRSLDFLMSFGERLSALIISAGMKSVMAEAVFVDARDLIKTDDHYGNAHVDFIATNANIESFFKGNISLPVVTGFIASTKAGDTTTLGRGGSDYTAAILGAALRASTIEIWTDVDGVMTADPRKVKQAFPLEHITYKEALEMSHFGAKVIHPPTIAPALAHKVPLWIKNTFNPRALGTLITAEHAGKEHMVCGLSSIDSVALLRLEGSGMVGVCGISMRLFGALAGKEINVILISQGSSEHSICFAVVPQQAEIARQAIEAEFALERHAGLIDPVVVEEQLSIIAAVGENMRQTPGIAGRLFGALGKNGINVVAMVQGSSEYNISIVVKKADECKALNVIHDEFFLSSFTTLNVFLVGVGLIGSTLLKQIEQHHDQLLKEHAIDIKVVGIASSEKMFFSDAGFELSGWKNALKERSSSMHMSEYVKRMKALNLSNSVFVDCTSSEDVAAHYMSILESNISIVTPNKKANSGPYAQYLKLKAFSQRRGVDFLYETNVGAGLPIISTLKDLLRSGDKVIKIEAILSGTLSYLFNVFQQGKTLSAALRDAQHKGFTEPDPREDLNGLDVMRKLLILVRECGHGLELADIQNKPLLPRACFDVYDVEEFYRQMEMHDPEFERKKADASARGHVLRYIASYENGHAAVGLQEIGPEHPFYHLSGSDNIISIFTERYQETPLVIKGQGAGADVTAGEVFADIIRTAS